MTTEDVDLTAEVQGADQDQETMTESTAPGLEAMTGGNPVPGVMKENDQGVEVAVHTHVLGAGLILTGQGHTVVPGQGQEVVVMKETLGVGAERHKKIKYSFLYRLCKAVL